MYLCVFACLLARGYQGLPGTWGVCLCVVCMFVSQRLPRYACSVYCVHVSTTATIMTCDEYEMIMAVTMLMAMEVETMVIIRGVSCNIYWCLHAAEPYIVYDVAVSLCC